jgi:hypothetical protein
LAEQPLYFRVPVEDIRPGDRFNISRRYVGMIAIDWSRVAGRVIRAEGRVWWVSDEYGNWSAPECIKAVFHECPESAHQTTLTHEASRYPTDGNGDVVAGQPAVVASGQTDATHRTKPGVLPFV